MSEWTATFIEVELGFHLEVAQARKVVLDALAHEPWPGVSEVVSEGKYSAEWMHEGVMRGLASKHGDGASIDLHITDTTIEHCWREQAGSCIQRAPPRAPSLSAAVVA